ncbi:MAG: phosphoglycerate dehydrogenase, partial [Candidatus Dormibacteraceae bacterium]
MSARPRVLVTGRLLDPAPALLAERCQVVQPDGRSLREAAVGCPGIVAHYLDTVDDALLATPGLRVVAAVSTGIDNIDLAAATRHGVVVVNAPTGNTTSAAEHAVALMLALARHIPEADASLKGGQWQRSRFVGVELRCKT